MLSNIFTWRRWSEELRPQLLKFDLHRENVLRIGDEDTNAYPRSIHVFFPGEVPLVGEFLLHPFHLLPNPGTALVILVLDDDQLVRRSHRLIVHTQNHVEYTYKSICAPPYTYYIHVPHTNTTKRKEKITKEISRP
jgi:hypothetical protein